MTQKGYDILCHIVKSELATFVTAVVSSTDSNIEKDYYDEIKKVCDINSIPFFNRKEANYTSSVYGLAISWRWLIHEPMNLIVIHDSILPRYRGFAPLVNSLKNGEREIGVTALFANNEYDKGDIICSEKLFINYPIKIGRAIDIVSLCYAKCIDFIFKHIAEGRELPRAKQNDNEATYSLWLNEDDYRIDWNQNSLFLERFVNAVSWPYRGAFTFNEGVKLRILEVESVDDVIIENRASGKIIFINGGCPVVVCGTGLLKVTTMLLENGGNALPLKKFRTRFS